MACCCRFFFLSLHLAKRREGSKPTPTPQSTHPAAFVFTCFAFYIISLLSFPSISCVLCFFSLSHTLFLLLSASFFAFIPSSPLLFRPIPPCSESRTHSFSLLEMTAVITMQSTAQLTHCSFETSFRWETESDPLKGHDRTEVTKHTSFLLLGSAI